MKPFGTKDAVPTNHKFLWNAWFQVITRAQNNLVG